MLYIMDLAQAMQFSGVNNKPFRAVPYAAAAAATAALFSFSKGNKPEEKRGFFCSDMTP